MIFASTAKGRIGDKPKAGTLFQLKDGLYWWIIRFIPDFFTQFATWHHTAVSTIHKAALEYNFETSWLEKNDLTDAELELFWQQIRKLKTGRKNWQQHFIAWLLVWITSVRPGSFTVCYGYEQGSRKADGYVRAEAETLRWEDFEFMRLDPEAGGGICVKVTFRYLKSFRVPHQKKTIEGVRKFSIMPLRSNRYHLDLALQLTALAFSRGLFEYDSLDDLFAGDERHVSQKKNVSKQPIFLKADQSGELLPEPMHERAINPKLKDICEMVGLLRRNTIYSFRRGAIVDARRRQGTEISQELANHVMGGKSIYSYDNLGLQDLDLANQRYGLETIDRATIRTMLSQAKGVRVDAQALTSLGLRTEVSQSGDKGVKTLIEKKSMELARSDEEFMQAEDAVREAYSAAKQHLMSLKVSPDLVVGPIDIRDQLNDRAGSQSECQTALGTINNAEHDRKVTLRRLKLKYSKEYSTQLYQDTKKVQKVAKSTQRAGGRGVMTVQESSTRGSGASVEDPFSQTVAELEAFDPDAQETDGDPQEDEIDPEEELDHGRTEPEQWKNLPDDDEIELQFEQGDAPTYTNAGRLNAAKSFIAFANKSSRNKDLNCIECAIDDTVPYEKKKQLYTLTKLDDHIKSNYHSRESQIMRAFHIAKDDKGRVECPLCRKRLPAKGFIAHIEEEHNEQIAL